MALLDTVLNALAPGWVGSSIGLLGIIAAVVTYLLTRQRTSLVYRHTGDRLLGLKDGGLPADITVQYRNQDIPRLTRSIVVMWNAGEKTISGTELVKSDPLRLLIPEDGRILSVTVLRVSREVIDFKCLTVETKPNEVGIEFAFLDPADGAAIEVLHTSEARNVEVHGTIRGLPKGIRNLGAIFGRRVIGSAMRRTMPRFMSPKVLGWVVVAIGAIFAAVGMFFPFGDLDRKPKTEVPVGLIVMSAGLLYATLGMALVWITRRRYPRTLRVDELE